MACGQGSHWLIESPTICIIFATRPNRIYVNFVFKHIHGAHGVVLLLTTFRNSPGVGIVRKNLRGRLRVLYDRSDLREQKSNLSPSTFSGFISRNNENIISTGTGLTGTELFSKIPI